MNSIQTIRARLGVTQASMAAGIGVTQGNVSNYERGQKMPPDVAGRLIEYALSLGHRITYDDVYAYPTGQAQPSLTPSSQTESQPQ